MALFNHLAPVNLANYPADHPLWKDINFVEEHAFDIFLPRSAVPRPPTAARLPPPITFTSAPLSSSALDGAPATFATVDTRQADKDVTKKWSPEDDALIFLIQTDEGRRAGATYEAVAVLVGRTANAVKCRWHAAHKPKFDATGLTKPAYCEQMLRSGAYRLPRDWQSLFRPRPGTTVTPRPTAISPIPRSAEETPRVEETPLDDESRGDGDGDDSPREPMAKRPRGPNDEPRWWRCPGNRKLGYCGCFIWGAPTRPATGTARPFKQHTGPVAGRPGAERCNAVARAAGCPCIVGRLPSESGTFVCACDAGAQDEPGPSPGPSPLADISLY